MPDLLLQNFPLHFAAAMLAEAIGYHYSNDKNVTSHYGELFQARAAG
jgi:hypothetical protein